MEQKYLCPALIFFLLLLTTWWRQYLKLAKKWILVFQLEASKGKKKHLSFTGLLTSITFSCMATASQITPSTQQTREGKSRSLFRFTKVRSLSHMIPCVCIYTHTLKESLKTTCSTGAHHDWQWQEVKQDGSCFIYDFFLICSWWLWSSVWLLASTLLFRGTDAQLAPVSIANPNLSLRAVGLNVSASLLLQKHASHGVSRGSGCGCRG